MFAIDWLGCLLTAGALACYCRGRLAPVRVLAAILLGELGRVALLLMTGDSLRAITVGGAFTRMQAANVPAEWVQFGGLFVGALLARLFGLRLMWETALYATLATMVGLVLLT